MSTGIGIGIAGDAFQTRAGLASGGGGASFLLDLYGAGIAAAYSVRKLSSSYTGAAIRVRESSGNTESDIGFDADGNLDEAALTAHVGGNDGFIVSWYDQSGNGRDATQTVSTRQMRVVSSGTIDKLGTRVAPNSIAVRTFYTPSSVISVTPPQTSVAVIKSSLTGGTNHFIGETLSGTYRFSGHTDFLQLNGGSSISGTGISQAHMVAVGLANSASSEIRANGSQVATGNTSGNAYSINEVFGVNATSNFEGNMQEILIYTADKTSDFSNIETDINTYYSIY
jgi:hypothetical protein